MAELPWDSIIKGGVSLLNGGLNYGLQMMTNQKNEELLREAWARDDSGMQRAVADAKKAGFSPLAAMGSTLGNTNPTSMTAPQLDLGGVGDAASEWGTKKLARDQFNLQKTQMETEMENMKETTRGLKLDNDLKEGKFEAELQKQAEELNKMMRDNEISEAAYIGSLMDLKARGLSDTYIDALLESRRGHAGSINMDASTINANKELEKLMQEYDDKHIEAGDKHTKYEDEHNISVEEHKLIKDKAERWLGENGYAAKELEYLANQAKKMGYDANISEGQQRSFADTTMPAITIGKDSIVATTIHDISGLNNWLTMVKALVYRQAIEQKSQIKTIIEKNPFLAAIDYVFGGAKGAADWIGGLGN